MGTLYPTIQLFGFAQKVSLRLSFTPGFSQVTTNRVRLENRLNGFPAGFRNTGTWLKPGVNETEHSKARELKFLCKAQLFNYLTIFCRVRTFRRCLRRCCRSRGSRCAR